MPLAWIRSRLATTRRAVLRRRRPLAALLTAVAVAAGVQAVAAPPPTRVMVLTATRDLPAGSVVTADDLARTPFASGSVPDGMAEKPFGRTLATAVRRGEPVTDVRLVAPALSMPGLADDGRVALPVRLPDASMVALLAVGDRIDLVATDPQAGGARTVASGVPVLALPRPRPELDDAAQPGALVVVGVLPADVTTVSDAAVRTFLSYSFAR